MSGDADSDRSLAHAAMSSVVLNILLIFLLVIIGGIFVAAEFALVSLRESQIRQLAHRGKRGQLVAKLTARIRTSFSPRPGRGHVSGFPCRGLRCRPAVWMIWHCVLERLGLSAGVAGTISLVLITIVISYVSIVIGELTAKRLALQRAEERCTHDGAIGGFHSPGRSAVDLAAGRLDQWLGADLGWRPEGLP